MKRYILRIVLCVAMLISLPSCWILGRKGKQIPIPPDTALTPDIKKKKVPTKPRTGKKIAKPVKKPPAPKKIKKVIRPKKKSPIVEKKKKKKKKKGSLFKYIKLPKDGKDLEDDDSSLDM